MKLCFSVEQTGMIYIGAKFQIIFSYLSWLLEVYAKHS